MQESFLTRIFVAYQSIYVKLKPKCSPDYSANIVKYISTANLHTVQDIFLSGSLFLSHAFNCVKWKDLDSCYLVKTFSLTWVTSGEILKSKGQGSTAPNISVNVHAGMLWR